MTGSASNPALPAEPRMRFGAFAAATAPALDLVHTLGRRWHRKKDPPIPHGALPHKPNAVLERRGWVKRCAHARHTQETNSSDTFTTFEFVFGVRDESRERQQKKILKFGPSAGREEQLPIGRTSPKKKDGKTSFNYPRC